MLPSRDIGLEKKDIDIIIIIIIILIIYCYYRFPPVNFADLSFHLMKESFKFAKYIWATKFVVQICILVIQIRTSVKKFCVYIIQIKIRVKSIQIRHRAGQRLFEHSNSHVGIQIRNKFIQFSIQFT